ncbi:metallophosphoesterase [Pseudoalteromonas sp. PS5]|uniref:metallophosphoesterase n=1 Tax=Pseudoalteromonas sp. PS5 TaxID=1437473 RepID=UPI000FFE6BDB|nr:metallophosphoesterase [Pseudoalteromonas sp. PS5]RXF01202.1 serine/threonine protein phosphatase [Pseudoalteromonas sp. PS5]
MKITLVVLLLTLNSTALAANNINFLAFGDGGYHPDYPKAKHIHSPKTKAEFIAAEKADWLAEHRPIAEFNHAPIYVYPGTETATEASGAAVVGKAMAELCQKKPCDFAIQLGDNIYPDGAAANDGKDDKQRMDDLILAPLSPLLLQNPNLVVYSALGNHDWKTSRRGVKLQTQWMEKHANFHMGRKGYYSYTIGEQGNDVEFFVLDTNMLLSGQHYYEIPLKPDGSEQGLASALASGQAKVEDIERHEQPVNGEDHKQLAWLANGLKHSTAKWKIVYGHHVIWSVGGTKYDEARVLRRLILPELCEYADAYIAGHEHDLELLTDDCSRVLPNNKKPKLPLIISGAASKMRGTHSPLAHYQALRYPEYDLVWNKAFIWGFAHIELDNHNDILNVAFYTTPRDLSGQVVSEQRFSFAHRSN